MLDISWRWTGVAVFQKRKDVKLEMADVNMIVGSLLLYGFPTKSLGLEQPDGGLKCACRDGFVLEEDRRSCRGTLFY